MAPAPEVPLEICAIHSSLFSFHVSEQIWNILEHVRRQMKAVHQVFARFALMANLPMDRMAHTTVNQPEPLGSILKLPQRFIANNSQVIIIATLGHLRHRKLKLDTYI